MPLAFLPPTALPPLNNRPAALCTCSIAEPPEPRLPSPKSPDHPQAATDKVYLEKVRAKLLHARLSASAKRPSPTTPLYEQYDADDDFIASLPDDLDALDDIIFDRGPLNKNQVRIFGAWLDQQVAGRKVGGPPPPDDVENDDARYSVMAHHKITLTKAEAKARAAVAFTSAMSAFNKGQYKNSVVLFGEAVDLVGAPSRLGGQYCLWHAQALDALGDKSAAVRMLDSLRTHSDADVRKVSREILFIITAPALEFEPGSFVEIPSFDEARHSAAGTPLLSSNFGPLRTALVEKQPEPHTLEWYMKKERPPPKAKDYSGLTAMILAVIIGCTLAFMFATPQT